MPALLGSSPASIRLQAGDALVIVDVQRDFVDGALAVPGAGAIIPVLNGYVERFRALGLPIVASRDWHPGGHCSFRESGGPWPPHCIAGTPGAAFADGLHVPLDAIVVSKGTHAERDAYSAFDGTALDLRLHARHVRRLFVGGLATDYCVLATVVAGRRLGYEVFLLIDAIRAVNVEPDDGAKAEAQMRAARALPATLPALEAPETMRG